MARRLDDSEVVYVWAVWPLWQTHGNRSSRQLNSSHLPRIAISGVPADSQEPHSR
jgi:hypothetical protein